MYYVTSKKLLNNPVLPLIEGMPEDLKYAINAKKNAKAYIGWGRKPSGQRAKLFSDQSGSQFISLEDGFLKSIPQIPNWDLSILVDYTGVHYDATCPSDLESMLETLHPSEEQILRANLFIKRVNKLNLSKYGINKSTNFYDKNKFKESPAILIIDQLKNDCSITYGMANEDSFEEMLSYAKRTFPDRPVLVKRHPLANSEGKEPCITDAMIQKYANCSLANSESSLDELFNISEHVFVVTSQTGLDALFKGKSVWCFGAPWYSGWGLTHDFVKVSRRTAKHSLASLAYLSFFEYAQYFNPSDRKSTSPEELLDLIESANNQIYLEEATCVGFSVWKHSFIQKFLGNPKRVEFLTKIPAKGKVHIVPKPYVLWASKSLCTLPQDEPRLYVEDGFIRSASLGSDLTEPYSLCIDYSTPYYDPETPSDLEKLIADTHLDQEQRWRIQGLIEMIVESDISKYNFKVDPTIVEARVQKLRDSAAGKKIILIPGQVEDDASVLRGCGKLNSIGKLVERVKYENPHSYLVYRPHPDVLAGNRKGVLNHELIDWVETGIPTVSLLAAVDEVHTLTSLTGFEALIRGKSVHCYGQPFYAGWGLTRDYYRARPRLRPSATLSELAYATLISYPKYKDPDTGLPLSVENVIVRILADLKNSKSLKSRPKRQATRFWRLLSLGFKQWT